MNVADVLPAGDHRSGGRGLLDTPLPVLSETPARLEPDDGLLGQVPELAVDAAGLEAELGEELLDLPHGVAGRPLEHRSVRHDERSVTGDRRRCEHVEGAGGVAHGLHRGVRLTVPDHAATVGDHSDGAGTVEAGEPHPDPAVDVDGAAGSSAVVVVEDLR